MANESERPPEQPKLPPQPIDATEQRLQVLEKTNEKMFTILVWGFGTLSALAFALVAGNIYSSHSSYEKDTVTLKQDVDILQKQLILAQQELTDSNNKKFQDFKNESEFSFAKLNSNLWSELIMMQQTNDSKWVTIAAALSNNLYALDDTIRRNVDTCLTNSFNEMNRALGEMATKVDKETSKARAFAFMAQGQVQLNTKSLGTSGLQVAAKSYLLSALDSLKAKDDVNMRRSIITFSQDCIPPLIASTSKAEFLNLVPTRFIVGRG